MKKLCLNIYTVSALQAQCASGFCGFFQKMYRQAQNVCQRLAVHIKLAVRLGFGARYGRAEQMIESTYWRQELRGELAWLKRHCNYRRWSEKQLVLYERRLMLVAFQIRVLLERSKVNDRARGAKMPVVRYKKIGSKPFTYVGAGFPEDRFDMESPEPSELDVLDVCNQLIHHYWMQIWSERTAFKGMLVFSDFMRHKWAYELLIEDLVSLFSTFANDSSAVTELSFHWNDKNQDYVAQYAR